MKRMQFDSKGRLINVDGLTLDSFKKADSLEYEKPVLRTSESLTFLKDEELTDTEREFWSLYDKEKKLEPLNFSNGKTQEDIVKEVVGLAKSGKKIIFIHGVCGTGKCLDKNTLIFCKPEESEYFAYHKISTLTCKKGKILCIDDNGNIRESDFCNVRETGIKPVYLLKTRTGREVIASKNHPFLTITERGLEWLPLERLNNTSYICLPNHLEFNESSSLDDNKVKVLAHLIAEGKLGDKNGSPKYYQEKNSEVRADYENALKELYPDGEIKNDNQFEVTILFRIMNTKYGTTNKLRLFIREFGLDGKKSKDKFVPKEIFNLNESKTALFLRTIFSCDGTIYTKNGKNEREQVIIEYDSISKKLVYDLSFLLLKLGIQHTITTHKFRDIPSYNYRITISNQEHIKKYIEKVGFIGRKQKISLEVYSRLKEHKFTNIDKIPRIIRDYLKNKGYSYNELDRYLNYEEIENLRKKIGFKKIRKDKLVKCPCVFKQGKIDFLRIHLKKINEHLKDGVLSFICNNSIIWDKVKKISYIKEDLTYDLEVKDYHNFIANGIITHNSAIALNIARALGKASIIVPAKSLQKQYEEDYMESKYLIRNGKKMKIAMITGRENHDSIIQPGVSCANPFLPDTIKLTEKNYNQIRKYYLQNPQIAHKSDSLDVKKLRRISIAPANPYWSPIAPKDIELPLKDAVKKKYTGLLGREFIFYHRKRGCSYYDQYQAYIDADIIMFNSAKYKIELALNRKPFTEVDIIDEADEFLDSFSTQEELNLTRLALSLSSLAPETESVQALIDKIIELIKLEEKNKRALGFGKEQIFHLKDTNMEKIFKLVLENPELQVEISLDELSYANQLIEAAHEFREFIDETYLTFRTYEKDLIINLVTANLSKKFEGIIKKSNILVLMSGTLHSPSVLKNIFGIQDSEFVDAETFHQGTIETKKTGKEINCSYTNLKTRYTRKQYLIALSAAVKEAKEPFLVHVIANKDLPAEQELEEFGITNLMPQEKFSEMQMQDKIGKRVSMFKAKKVSCLYSTKCSRGMDFPGEICNSVIFTKYPNPNVSGTFWKILKKTHPDYYWEFYQDKAYREFLQRIYRAVRSEKDHVYVLSPDSRVIEAVERMNKNRR